MYKKEHILLGGALLLALTVGCGGDRDEIDVPKPEGKPPSLDVAPVEGSAKPKESRPRKAATEDPVVAEVGPLRIRLSEVLDYTRPREAGANIAQGTRTLVEVKEGIRQRGLKYMVDRRLLTLGAAKTPEWVTDASWEIEVQRQLTELGPDEIARRGELAGLDKENYMDQFRKFVREEMMKQAILEHEVDQGLEVSEEEVLERYERDRDTAYRRPDAWSVYRVVQFLDRDREDELPKLLDRLEALRAELAPKLSGVSDPKKKGAIMAPFSKEHSQEPSENTSYIYLYDTPEAKFDPLFKKKVKESTLGELSPVFELAGDEDRVGACFFLTFAYKPGETAPFERSRDIVKKGMLEEMRQARLDALFARLETEFPVTIYEDRLYQGLIPSEREE